MKTKPIGTDYVPAYRSTIGSKPSTLTSETRADFYYVTAIAFTCATFIFPPFVVGAIACVIKAKQMKGGKA